MANFNSDKIPSKQEYAKTATQRIKEDKELGILPDWAAATKTLFSDSMLQHLREQMVNKGADYAALERRLLGNFDTNPVVSSLPTVRAPLQYHQLSREEAYIIRKAREQGYNQLIKANESLACNYARSAVAQFTFNTQPKTYDQWMAFIDKAANELVSFLQSKEFTKMKSPAPQEFHQFIHNLNGNTIYECIENMPMLQEIIPVLGVHRAELQLFYILLASCNEGSGLTLCADKSLRDAFPWSKSPQGYDYWNGVYTLALTGRNVDSVSIKITAPERTAISVIKEQDAPFHPLHINNQQTYGLKSYLFNYDKDMDNCMFVTKRVKMALHFALENNPIEEWTTLELKDENLVTEVLPSLAFIPKDQLDWEEIYTRYGFKFTPNAKQEAKKPQWDMYNPTPSSLYISPSIAIGKDSQGEEFQTINKDIT